MKAVILVGGKGTRLRPLTYNIPKAMVPILNRPFLEYLLGYLKRYGVIKKIPKSVSKKVYIDIENEMKSFSKKMKIPMQDLDLLFWSKETGIIFK